MEESHVAPPAVDTHRYQARSAAPLFCERGRTFFQSVEYLLIDQQEIPVEMSVDRQHRVSEACQLPHPHLFAIV